jgi:hypothetical protein
MACCFCVRLSALCIRFCSHDSRGQRSCGQHVYIMCVLNKLAQDARDVHPKTCRRRRRENNSLEPNLPPSPPFFVKRSQTHLTVVVGVQIYFPIHVERILPGAQTAQNHSLSIDMK